MEVEINNFCDSRAEVARCLNKGPEVDPFFSDQICGITYKNTRLHGTPKAAILMASHGAAVQEYIYEKSKWSSSTFNSVDWVNFDRYVNTLDRVQHTNVVKLAHNWVNDGHQRDSFSEGLEQTLRPSECG